MTQDAQLLEFLAAGIPSLRLPTSWWLGSAAVVLLHQSPPWLALSTPCTFPLAQKYHPAPLQHSTTALCCWGGDPHLPSDLLLSPSTTPFIPLDEAIGCGSQTGISTGKRKSPRGWPRTLASWMLFGEQTLVITAGSRHIPDPTAEAFPCQGSWWSSDPAGRCCC